MIGRLQQLIRRLLSSFAGSRLDDELNAEMASHLQFAIEENLQRGMNAEEARRQALVRFGGVEQARLRQRDARSLPFLDILRQDLRYTFRKLRRDRVFTLVAVLILALGIGGNTAMFSVIRAVLLKPLPYRDPGRLVLVADGVTPIRFEELKAASRSYTEVGAFTGQEDMALSGVGEPEVLKGARVSANFLQVLGITPLLGRSFLPEEDKTGAPAVAMISAELWRRRFSRDPSIIGKTVTLAGTPHAIIGVLPSGFQFPFSGADVWVPRPSEWSVISLPGRPDSPFLGVFGRLKPHLDLREATAELSVLNRQYAAAHPGMLDSKPGSPDIVQPFKDTLVSDVRSELWMLFGAVAFVLLIVCANIASLLLARATSRAREFAVRAAVGAGSGRIIRQLLTESILLASLGGGLGLGLAAGSLSGIRNVTFIDLPRAGEIRIDGAVLGFAALLSFVTGVLFGLVPALTASRPDLAGVLRGSGEAPSATGSKSRLRFGPRGLLVVGQVALSIVLLIGATLLIESLARVYRVDPGFETSHLLTMNISLSPTRYDTDEKRARFYDELVERAESLPGVRSAAVTLTLPMSDTWMGAPVQLAGTAPMKLNERPIAVIQDITPAYFHTLQIALKRGLEFTAHDNAQSVPVAIVNENLARLFWPQYPSGPNPIGQHILVGASPQPPEIIGIAPNVRQYGRDDNPKPEVYFSCAQKPPQSAMLAVRTNGDPLSFANAVRNQVLAIDGDQPVSAVATMDDLVEASERQLRLMMTLLGIFAGAATLIASIGIYGVIAYSVGQRTKEIGIRRALGAQQSDILSLVVGQGLRLVLAGVLLGVCGALAVTRLLQDLLFRVSATDPATFVGVAILFVVVALVASYVPARRAIGIDPMAALRIG
ncbi:MAG: ABC transporter permease [Terriglobales bacterium]